MTLISAPASLLLVSWTVALLGSDAGVPYWTAFLSAIFVFVGLCLLSSPAPVPRGALWTASFLCVCLLAGLCRILSGVAIPAEVPYLRDIRGTVSLERQWGGGRVILVDSVAGRFLVRLPSSRVFSEGATVEMTGQTTPLHSEEARKRDRTRISSFREDIFWRARGVIAEFIPASIGQTRETTWSFSSFRARLTRAIVASMPERMWGYLLAAWIGVRDPGLGEDHARWGTAHLLAVSGFHVGLVVGVLLLLLRPVSLFLARSFPAVFHEGGNAVTAVAASCLLWGYVCLAGAAASALRAALMLQVILAGRLLGRPAAPVNSVCVAACALLLWNPWWFWDLGWRLSVVAALILATMADLRGFGGCLVSGPLVWVATYPLVAASFGDVPVVGLLLNFAAIPAFSLIFPAISVLALPAIVGLPGGAAAAAFGERILAIWECFADTLTAIVPQTVSWSILGAAGATIVFLSVVGMGMALKFRRSLLFGVLGAVVVFELI
jgi:competence protein ComEC